MIRAVGFDFGGVLAGPTGEAFDTSMATLLGVDTAQYLGVYKRYNQAFNLGNITRETLWQRVASEFDQTANLEDILKIQSTRETVELNNGMHALLTRLGTAGLKLGMLTNNTLEQGQRIRSMDYSSLFGVIHVSAETGNIKPAPVAFTDFANDLKEDPENILFIDDDKEVTNTARSCGMQAIHFVTVDQCSDELESLRVL